MIPWFLLPFLFTLARAFSVSRQPTAGSAPTCEELQEFWDVLSHTILRMGPENNEIPTMPVRMNEVLDHILTGLSRKGKHSKLYKKYAKAALSNQFDFTDLFAKDPWMVQPPPALPNPFLHDTESQMFSEPVLVDNGGFFGEFHELNSPTSEGDPRPGPSAVHPQTESGAVSGFGSSSSPSHSSVPLGDRQNGDIEYYIPQWGSPDEVDTFGNFLDFDIGSPHLTIARTPKDTTGEWPGLPQRINNQKSRQIACDGLVNSDCTKDEQCSCKGRKNLQCIRGKCLNYDLNSDMAEKYGTWHDGPIPQLQLRVLAMPRKKNYKSIFM